MSTKIWLKLIWRAVLTCAVLCAAFPTAAPPVIAAAPAQPVAGTQAVQLEINIASAALDPGREVDIPLAAVASQGVVLGALTLEVQYDPSVLQPVDCRADPDNLFDADSCNLSYGPGAILLNFLSDKGRTGDFNLAILRLRAIKAGQQTMVTILPLTVASPSGKAVEVLAHESSITVADSWLLYLPWMKTAP
ncbi:MAG TPA: cohesin domain-containing protein [Anaerolineales bacterium]|nr:cohesin domain-containing protein [Anaerolineales bacterium]